MRGEFPDAGFLRRLMSAYVRLLFDKEAGGVRCGEREDECNGTGIREALQASLIYLKQQWLARSAALLEMEQRLPCVYKPGSVEIQKYQLLKK